MNKKFHYIIFFVALQFGYPINIWSQVNIIPESQNANISFTENKGQWTNDIDYKFSSSALHILLKKDRIAYYILNENDVAEANEHIHKSKKKQITINGNYLTVLFKNANEECTPIAAGEPEKTYKNYYLGNDASKWTSKVQSFQNIIYPNIYNQIDLQINAAKNNVLRYDWILKPNADLKDIQLQIDGADSIYINYGELFIAHTQGLLKEQKPFAYQIINSKRILVNVQYILKNNCISFEAEHYNHDYDLIIDPDLIFSTYSGSTEDNFGFTATYDSKGNLYAGGITTSEFGGTYPVTPGAFQLTYRGGTSQEPVNLPCDITISKYSNDGKQLLYATYLGGSNNEYPHSLVVDSGDNLIIMGSCTSIDFPVTTNAYDTSQNGDIDIIVAKLSLDGSTLLGSTYVGGKKNDGLNSHIKTFYADDFRGDVIIDKDNNIIIGSCSYSLNFPFTVGSFGGPITDSIQKGVVFKLSPNCDHLIFSSAFQGNSEDVIYSVDLNVNNDIFIAGSTNNNIIGSNATNTYIGGKSDGFFAKIKNDGSTILKLKYFGTALSDQIFSLELDNDENIYIVGNSLGNIQPKGDVYSVTNGKQFISKINKDFDTIEFISTFGRGSVGFDISINAFLLDDCGRLYISGWGCNDARFGLGGNTLGLPTTKDAFQPNTDGNDFYLMIMNENAEKILYATFFGGNSSPDHVDGGTSRFDKKGVIYQSVCASCPAGSGFLSDFPISSDAVFKKNVSPRCSNAAFKMSFRFKEVNIIYSFDTCANTINLTTPTENALNYLWIFPNGKTSNMRNPTLSIDEVNNQEIMLILNSGTSCADTAKTTIHFADSLNKIKTANVFTPNNDGINDYFKLEGLSVCGEAQITIYNRWGQEIYKSSKKNFNWDGNTDTGEPVSEGIYFYIGSYKKQNGPEVKLHGTVTLIR